jgi:hypothetical protein
VKRFKQDLRYLQSLAALMVAADFWALHLSWWGGVVQGGVLVGAYELAKWNERRS